ncbi:hypothetical protein LLE49_10375 [Alicyclobacillus tolerans]|uniref:hypothetical protein n=1 Tax=Alicyclobacillus tolerans TaxID=90970 RepID=UPI001F3A74C9|nr:hypothetical protein [Alicyclobacillus tolerans]MCF8565119.1 hypothetical protein [Alicyclobacillus tolerans]
MSWTQGQSAHTNLSPFLNQGEPSSSSYIQQGSKRDARDARSRSNYPPSNTAATFTQEGLQAFAAIFSTSVEAAIAKALPGLIEPIIERKMQELKDQILEEVKSMLANSDQTSKTAETSQTIETTATNEPSVLIETATTAITTTAATDTAATEDTANTADTADISEAAAPDSPDITETIEAAASAAVETSQPNSPLSLQMEFELVRDALKAAAGAVSMNALRENLPHIRWGRNFSAKMNRFMHMSNGQIERVKHGFYRYREV